MPVDSADLQIRDRPSPNHDARPAGQAVDILLLHYTGMRSGGEALDRLADPAAKVSAHYLIEEDGAVWRLVPEDRRAWHAGVGSWQGARDINARSIGIELVNPGHEFGYRPFPEPQMAALEALATGILARHPIAPCRVLGHSDVAPLRKEDPGELFDWARLARAGIGLWPAAEQSVGGPPADIGALQAGLSRYGYDAPATGVLDAGTRAVVTAFQRHFRPRRVDGAPDAGTALRLSALLALID
jgi:N-acetylmuramoyl-L-alanine amidase